MYRFPKTATKKPVEIAPRNFANEQLLGTAIQKHVVVRFRYKDDLLARDFEPSAVYHTPTGKVCASGEMTSNPNDLSDQLGPHNFEVGLMTGLTLTDRKFIPDPRFNRYDAKYRNGIICSV